VHGAAGGLGTLALQMLSIWGANTTAIAKASALDACRRAGAASVVDAATQPFSDLGHSFDATLNFATWDDDLALIGCLKEGALGHATTVHPMLGILDELGWIKGGLKLLGEKRRHRAALPKGTKNYGWVAFRPNKQALSDLGELVERNVLALPIGLRVPLARAGEAFDHVRSRRAGRAVILPN
jgi:NADPH:quinone reductase-like Zn-dependent oxidoreductase